MAATSVLGADAARRAGSSPALRTICGLRTSGRTAPSEGADVGSIPIRPQLLDNWCKALP